MTEQTMPVGGTAVAEPPAPELPFDGGETSDSDNRKKLLMVGAVLGVLVLAVAAFFLTRGGSSTPVSSGAPLPPPAAGAGKSGHKTTAHKPLTLPKKYHGHVGRDPFKPLYTQPSAAPATSTNGSTTTTTDGTTTPTDGSTSPTTSGSTTTTTHTRVYRPIWLQLKSITPRSAEFVVGYSNGKSLRAVRFTVQAPPRNGSTLFAKTFALLRLSQGRAIVQYGDGTPFLLDAQHNTMIVN
jgi:hypothetical protein